MHTSADEAIEGAEAKAKTEVDDEEEEDGDETLSREEKLQTVLGYMRGLHRYCFFCGCQVRLILPSPSEALLRAAADRLLASHLAGR
jgi:hypothetical protein